MSRGRSWQALRHTVTFSNVHEEGGGMWNAWSLTRRVSRRLRATLFCGIGSSADHPW